MKTSTLPCPFCGHNYVHVHVGSTRLHAVAVCGYCGAKACEARMTNDNWIINHSGIENVYKEWNTRCTTERDKIHSQLVDCATESNNLRSQLAELKAKLALLKKRCEYCDGTGLVHGLDGELRGVCTQCDASKQILEL